MPHHLGSSMPKSNIPLRNGDFLRTLHIEPASVSTLIDEPSHDGEECPPQGLRLWGGETGTAMFRARDLVECDLPIELRVVGTASQ